MVVAGAWGANLPASFSLLPYGHSYPVDPGNFSQPLSALILIGSLSALISGRKAGREYRVWLWLPILAFAIIWILTQPIFWPMINEQWAVARGRMVKTPEEAVQMVRHWYLWDSARIVLISVGFIASVRAISPIHRMANRQSALATLKSTDRCTRLAAALRFVFSWHGIKPV